ncbi:MAG: hypothetical protein ABIS50_19080 [Luteolibacter sp.]|uniref:hypothetical protein n=1 Tax=Luteolibacter sp. TaxID=1962973 RepID=UPI0032641672
MKTLIKFIVLPAFLFLTPLACASLYEGSWKNKTFGSTGALTIDLTIKNSRASGSFDLDGPVFGGLNPPAIPFDFPVKANGSGKIKVNGTIMGDFNGTIDEDGNFSVTITNIPGALTEARINGVFDIKLEKLTADYVVDNAGGPYANGVVEAHVHKAPIVNVAKTVNVTGTTGKVQAKVVTNTTIKNIKASTTGIGNITIAGKNPYQITVKNLTVGTTPVKITVTNNDGLSTTKTVKFIR